MHRFGRLGLFSIAALLLTSLPVMAGNITVDEILFPAGNEATPYSGDVTMSYDSGSGALTITLQNTTSGAAVDDADNLLTGIGFNMPDGVTITGGSADMSGQTAVNFTAPADGNISNEWGYDTDPLDSGSLVDVAVGTYNQAVSSMESQTTDKFAHCSTFGPYDLDGPDGGLLSAAAGAPTSLDSDVEAISDSLVVTVQLDGYAGNEADFLAHIEENYVALTFGSPTTTGGVPEPSTLLLFGAGVVAIGIYRRRRGQAV